MGKAIALKFLFLWNEQPMTIDHAKTLAAEKSSRCFAFLYSFGGILAIGIFYRNWIFESFEWLPSDAGDTQLIIRLLEHWFEVARGDAQWRSPTFFYPTSGVLGYTDVFFLISLPYVVARMIGADIFSALQLTLVTLSLFGYLGMLFLLKTCRLAPIVCLIGALIFTNLNVVSVAMGGGHFQLCWLFALPWSVVLLLRYIQVERKLSAAGWFYGSAFSVFFPLSFFTAFYVSWFFVFLLIVIGVLALGWFGPRKLMQVLFGDKLEGLVTQISTFVLIAAIMFVPFLMTYLPVLIDAGGRGYPPYSPTIPDLLNVGPNNFLLSQAIGWIFAGFGLDLRSNEAQFGFPPFMLALFLATSYFYARDCIRSRFAQRGEQPVEIPLASQAVFLVSVGVLLIMAFVMTINGHSLWWVVYKYIPGAKAIRVTTRYLMILSFPILAVAMFGLNRLHESLGPRLSDLRGRNKLMAMLSILAATLALEQVARTIVSVLPKQEQLALFERIAAPPSGCRVSFLSRVASTDHQPRVALQTDMMLISALVNLPTLNGYDGLSPFGWSMDDPRASNYLSKVAFWLSLHGLESQACGLDLESGKWEADISARVGNAVTYRLGDVIDFRAGGNASSYMAFGWQDSEPIGTWTNGPHAVLLMNPNNSGQHTQLILFGKVYPLVTSSSPDLRISIALNGVPIAQKILTTATDLAIPIDTSVLNHGALLRLDFFVENPKVPAELGMSTDTRRLGLLVETLSLRNGE